MSLIHLSVTRNLLSAVPMGRLLTSEANVPSQVGTKQCYLKQGCSELIDLSRRHAIDPGQTITGAAVRVI